MSIVHVSDLHCGPRLKKEMLQEAIDEINDMGPDIVIVTGDLTEKGLTTEFQEAKHYLDQVTCKRLVVGSGNHDSRTTGYLHACMPKRGSVRGTSPLLNDIIVSLVFPA